MRRPYVIVIAIAAALAAGVGVWLGLRGTSDAGGGAEASKVPPAATTPEPSGRQIKATLFYVAPDGQRLVGVERDVPYGETTTEQARYLVQQQLGEAPAPYVSALPSGTTLRALFVTERGEAFVDLSRDVAEHHTGGSLDELFTVYAIVNVLGTNLPRVGAVQILIEGQEVETLAGHVDLRHPLAKSLKWVQSDGTF